MSGKLQQQQQRLQGGFLQQLIQQFSQSEDKKQQQQQLQQQQQQQLQLQLQQQQQGGQQIAGNVKVYTGPKQGKFMINKKGKKVYIDRKTLKTDVPYLKKKAKKGKAKVAK